MGKVPSVCAKLKPGDQVQYKIARGNGLATIKKIADTGIAEIHTHAGGVLQRHVDKLVKIPK